MVSWLEPYILALIFIQALINNQQKDALAYTNFCSFPFFFAALLSCVSPKLFVPED